MRFVLWWLHRAFGLAGALWLLLLGFTGAVLAFYSELDTSLNPELFAPRGAEAVVAIDDAVRSVESFKGGREVVSFLRGTAATDIWTFRVAHEENEGSLEIFLDPTTGQVTGERIWDAVILDRPHLLPLLYRLHYALLLGYPGEWFIGLVGLLWLVDHLAAAVLSFPSRNRWRQSFRIRWIPGPKLTFDLHRSLGVWLVPVTLVVAATGTLMSWRGYTESLVGIVSERSPWPGSNEAELPMPLKTPPQSYADAVASSGAPNVQGAVYDAKRGVYLVNAFDSRDLTRDYGQRMIVVDATTGAIRSMSHLAEGTAADIIDAWLLPLHSGKAAGWTGRLLVCASGLALCSFVVTGLMIWARRRAVRVTQ